MALPWSPDRLITCFVKNTIREFHWYSTSSWERKTAVVTGHTVLDPWLGCPAVMLCYTFESKGRSIKGRDAIPFTGLFHAQAFAHSFPRNASRTIRVNPRDSNQTRFFETDQ
jgi:hypothetical protein